MYWKIKMVDALQPPLSRWICIDYNSYHSLNLEKDLTRPLHPSVIMILSTPNTIGHTYIYIYMQEKRRRRRIVSLTLIAFHNFWAFLFFFNLINLMLLGFGAPKRFAKVILALQSLADVWEPQSWKTCTYSFGRWFFFFLVFWAESCWKKKTCTRGVGVPFL